MFSLYRWPPPWLLRLERGGYFSDCSRPPMVFLHQDSRQTGVGNNQQNHRPNNKQCAFGSLRHSTSPLSLFNNRCDGACQWKPSFILVNCTLVCLNAVSRTAEAEEPFRKVTAPLVLSRYKPGSSWEPGGGPRSSRRRRGCKVTLATTDDGFSIFAAVGLRLQREIWGCDAASPRHTPKKVVLRGPRPAISPGILVDVRFCNCPASRRRRGCQASGQCPSWYRAGGSG